MLTSPPEVAGPRRVTVVDELRGLAALSVAWFHFTNGNQRFLEEGLLKASGAYGWLGVEVFFVISGFVIPLSMQRAGYRVRAHLPGFVVRRLVRLEPPYLACILLTLLLWYLSSWTPGYRGGQPEWSLSQLLLHVGYLVAFTDERWLNPVFWTLAIEFQFYLGVAVLFPLVGNPSRTVALASIAVLALLSFVPLPARLVFPYLSLFALGMLTFHFHQRRLARRLYVGACLCVAAVSASTLGWPVAATGLLSAMAIAFLRGGGHPLLLFLGTISYSVYLLHVPIGGRVVNLGERLVDSDWAAMLTLVAAMAATLIAATVFHRLVERPAVDWSRRVPYDMRPAAAVSP